MKENKYNVNLIFNDPSQEDSNYNYREIEKVFPCLTGDAAVFSPVPSDLTALTNNQIIQGDNLKTLHYLNDNGYQSRFDLIYLDPPYFSDSYYTSKVMVGNGRQSYPVQRTVFSDVWKDGMAAYLGQLRRRLLVIKELLSPQGNLFVHLDWHIHHYVKIVLDEVFSPDNFINEIVWCYGGGSASRRHFHRKHDIILWYAKTDKYIFNPQYRPYTPGTLQRGLTRVKGDKYRLDERGALMQDWWVDINKILSPTAYENKKFPTQKPMALLKRIVSAGSNPGSLVGDFYAGSGTMAEVCEEIDRNWIIADSSPVAIQTTLHRLLEMAARPFTIASIEDNKPNDSRLIVTVERISHNVELDRLDIRILDYQVGNELEVNTPGKLLIDLWELDLDCSQEIFCSQVQVAGQSSKKGYILPLELAVLVPVNQSPQITVKVWDIFGNSCSKSLKA
ncbi:DNA methyltransferase [Syntrophomonas erecta]